MFTPSASPPTLRIAIYRTSSIGDVVLATSCLNLLDSLAVAAEITWIGRGASLDLIAKSWPKVRTLEMRRNEASSSSPQIAPLLKDVHLMIDLQCNLRSNWLARTLRKQYDIPTFSAEKAQVMRNRLILEARMRGRRKPLPPESLVVRRPQFEMMCDALRRGIKHQLPVEMRDGLAASFPPRLPLSSVDKDQPWFKELNYGAWLAIAPGAAHETKKADPEAFVDILRKLKETLAQHKGDAPVPLGLVFLGDETDRKDVLKIQADLVWTDPMLNLAGKLSLWETALALTQCSVLLSNDSSLAHIAEAVETPIAMLFGPTIESFGFAPRMAESQAFSTRLGCRPCSKHGRVDCRYDDKLCFALLPADQVATHLATLLTATRARHRVKPDPRGLSYGQDTMPEERL